MKISLRNEEKAVCKIGIGFKNRNLAGACLKDTLYMMKRLTFITLAARS